MILSNRPFERNPPSKDAKCIFIFCEGKKREFQYFKYFRELDSRINIMVHEIKPHDNNSPKGLLEIAISGIVPSKENPDPLYTFQENDEVWLVVDFDDDAGHSRIPQLNVLMQYCQTNERWNVAISNPCFEVWLYFHLCCKKLNKANLNRCATWKSYLNSAERGGFNSKKHPQLIQDAQIISENNFKKTAAGFPEIGSTDVYKLANSILPLLEKKLESIRQSHTRIPT